MAVITTVDVTNGVPTAGTGTVSTIDALIPVGHDGVDSGSPIKLGFRALAHGTNPTAVAAADRTDWLANRAGIPWVIAGHPNIISRANVILASDGAQTNAALVSVSAGSKIVLTSIAVAMDARNTVNTQVRIGFGTASVPAAALAGTNAIVLHGFFGPGGGRQKGASSGIVAIGADDEDLRITCDSPTSGAVYVDYSYYTIES